VRGAAGWGGLLAAVGLLTLAHCSHVAGLEELTFDGAGGHGGSSSGTGGVGPMECGDTPVPPGGECPVEVCNGGCADGICTVDCSGTVNNPCPGSTIVCPEGFDCDVMCGTTPGCAGATILCPDTYDCNVLCAGEDTCAAVTVECSATGMCYLACSEAPGVCQGAHMTCGHNSCVAGCLGDTFPTMDCEFACECDPC